MSSGKNITHFWIGLFAHHVSADSKYELVTWNWKSYFQLIMAVLGIMGNALVISVYVRKLRFNIATNILILNLAVADLLTSIFIIPLPKLSQVGHSSFWEFYCSFAWSDVSLWVSIVGSVNTLTILSFERYLAVVYPIKYKILFVGVRSKLIIGAIWIMSILINTYIVFVADSLNGRCVIQWPRIHFQPVFGVFLFMTTFFIPMVIMVVAHTRAIISIRSQAKNLRLTGSVRKTLSMALLRTRTKVIETLFMVVAIFIVCWLPDQMAYMLYNLGVLKVDYLSTLLYDLLVLLAFGNSCANPIIYTFKNKEFRRSLKTMFCIRRRNKVHIADENRIASTGQTMRTP